MSYQSSSLGEVELERGERGTSRQAYGGLSSGAWLKHAYLRYFGLAVVGLLALLALIGTGRNSSGVTGEDGLERAPSRLLAEINKKKSAEFADAPAQQVCLDPDYTQVTLKTAHEMSMVALFTDLQGEKKFEASDVIRVGDHYLVVYDNLYQIGRIDQQLPFHSSASQLIRSDPPREGDSGFEAILYDEPTGTFYVIVEAELEEFHDASLTNPGSDKSDRDAAESKKTGQYHAWIEEIKFHQDSSTYKLKDRCRSQFKFISGNKGFEGAVHVNVKYGDAPEMYLIGLCEGNFCEGGENGRKHGNGRLVVMKKREADGSKQCEWMTVNLLALPKLAAFADYSAIAIRPMTDADGRGNIYRLAVTSQESSQVWIGELRVGDRSDAKDWQLSDGVVFNFPRDEECNIRYCNVEGISFVDDNLLVAVSDKMKSGGRQHYRCLQKDQSIHTFVLP